MVQRKIYQRIHRKRYPWGAAFALLIVLGPLLVLDSSSAVDSGRQDGGSDSPSHNFIHGFLSEGAIGKTQTLWLTREIKERAAAILGHRFNGLRVRYWGEHNRTVWILDEVGKEMPITIGVAVEAGKLLNIQILEYRESRGGEVRYPFFTDQFKGLILESENQDKLNGYIDGITGATLSVAAVRKVAILALVFHQHTPYRAE